MAWCPVRNDLSIDVDSTSFRRRSISHFSLSGQHDSRIFQNSRIYMRYVQRELSGILVGDAGYPCLPFLLTPIQNPQTDEEITYNILHIRTRQIVERTFRI